MGIQNDISWLLIGYQREQHSSAQLSLANENILYYFLF